MPTPILAFNEKSHRYRLDDAWVPSVTTIINGGLPKPALVAWAGTVVAEHVADHLDDVVSMAHLGREPMVKALASVPDEIRNKAGVRGTLVHELAEHVVHGRAVEVPPAISDRVEGYARWLDRFEPVPLATEMMCANRADWWAGRFDLIARIGEVTWLLDNKTSKSVYGDTSLQVGAYASAEFYVDPAAPDVEVPAIPVDRIGVLHVTDDGTDLFDLGDIESAYAEFLAAKVIYAGAGRRRRLIGRPVATPGPVAEAVGW